MTHYWPINLIVIAKYRKSQNSEENRKNSRIRKTSEIRKAFGKKVEIRNFSCHFGRSGNPARKTKSAIFRGGVTLFLVTNGRKFPDFVEQKNRNFWRLGGCRTPDTPRSRHPWVWVWIKRHPHPHPAKVQVWLSAPSHEINGNDTVTIQWRTSECTDCFTWTPKQLSFNSKNFQERQTLTITRLGMSEQSIFIPILEGGGFEFIEAATYSLSIRWISFFSFGIPMK